MEENQTDIATWAQGILLEGRRRFTFEGHEYQRQVLEDDHPNQVWSKAAQGGWTHIAMVKTLDNCLHLEGFRAAMYLFPTDRDVSDFSQARFAPLLADNPELAAQTESVATKKTDRVTLKRIGNAHLYFRGMKDTRGAQIGAERRAEDVAKGGSAKLLSVPADMLVFDELDRMSPFAVRLALKRLQHSDYRIRIRLSNPSIPGYGIDAAFAESDRHRWLIPCLKCSTRTCPELDFPEKPGQEIRIIQRTKDGRHYLACRKCGAEIDPDEGEWIAEAPSVQDCRGYSFSQLSTRQCDLQEVVKEYQKAEHLEVLYNMTIGRAWASAQTKLDRQTVLARCGEQPMLGRSQVPCTMGVDVGKNLHVVISRRHPTRPGLREIVCIGIIYDAMNDEGSPRQFGDLDPLMERFNVHRCVIDGGPDQNRARAFQKRHGKKKVWLSYFNDHQRGAIAWNEDQGIVTVNRTEILDGSHALMSATDPEKVVLPHEQPMLETFANQLAADARQLLVEDRTGSKRYVYVKIGEENHFDFAYTYDFMAWMDEPPPPRSRIIASNRRGRRIR